MKVFSTDKMVEKAMNSPRLRHILKCNQTYDERPQIFFNCLLEDTFIAPHNHELDPKTEYILLLEGDIAVIFFNTDGSVQEVKSFSSKKKNSLICIESHQIHTVLCMSKSALILEVKDGPFFNSKSKNIVDFCGKWGKEDSFLKSLKKLVKKM